MLKTTLITLASVILMAIVLATILSQLTTLPFSWMMVMSLVAAMAAEALHFAPFNWLLTWIVTKLSDL